MVSEITCHIGPWVPYDPVTREGGYTLKCGLPVDPDSTWGRCAEHERLARLRRCRVCDTVWLGTRGTFQYVLEEAEAVEGMCSPECRREAERRRSAARREQVWVPPSPVVCERCGEKFEARRSDARFCSTRCRVAAHRAQNP
jgi:hypothetical protein